MFALNLYISAVSEWVALESRWATYFETGYDALSQPVHLEPVVKGALGKADSAVPSILIVKIYMTNVLYIALDSPQLISTYKV